MRTEKNNEPEVNVAHYFVIFKIQKTECKDKVAHNIFYQSSFTMLFTDFVTEVLSLKFLVLQAFDKVFMDLRT